MGLRINAFLRGVTAGQLKYTKVQAPTSNGETKVKVHRDLLVRPTIGDYATLQLSETTLYLKQGKLVSVGTSRDCHIKLPSVGSGEKFFTIHFEGGKIFAQAHMTAAENLVLKAPLDGKDEIGPGTAPLVEGDIEKFVGDVMFFVPLVADTVGEAKYLDIVAVLPKNHDREILLISAKRETDERLRRQLRERAVQATLGLSSSRIRELEEKILVHTKTIGRVSEVAHIHREAFFWRGDAELQMGRYEAAISDFTRALDINPTYPSFYKRGEAEFRLGRYEEAIADFKRALEHDPNVYYLLYTCGCAELKLERYEEALAHFNQAINVEPQDRQALLGRAYALDKLGRHEKPMEPTSTEAPIDLTVPRDITGTPDLPDAEAAAEDPDKA